MTPQVGTRDAPEGSCPCERGVVITDRRSRRNVAGTGPRKTGRFRLGVKAKSMPRRRYMSVLSRYALPGDEFRSSDLCSCCSCLRSFVCPGEDVALGMRIIP